MRIHHLNCGSMCPLGGYLFDGFSPTLGSSHLSCHCLLVETDSSGLVLVDTGFGTRDVTRKWSRLSPFFIGLCRPHVKIEDTALRQIERLGFSARDVRHIVLTHLDFDHAGGIDDFPEAKIHIFRKEKVSADKRAGFIAHGRYRPVQYRDHSAWRTYDPTEGEKWFSFDAVRSLEGLPPEILLIPLIGHTEGHCGVALQDDNGWLLHAGDAYFYREEMKVRDPSCTPGLRFYQKLMEVDRSMRLRNQERLRELIRAHSQEVRVFSAHDFLEFKSFTVNVTGAELLGSAA